MLKSMLRCAQATTCAWTKAYQSTGKLGFTTAVCLEKTPSCSYKDDEFVVNDNLVIRQLRDHIEQKLKVLQ